MQLVLAIVHGDDVDRVVDALTGAAYRVTRIDTVGGFLKRPNATLLIGIEAEQAKEVISTIRQNCTPHTEPRPVKEGIPMYAATIFVLEARETIRV